MNSVNLIGKIMYDIELQVSTGGVQTVYVKFTLSVKQFKKGSNEMLIPCIAFRKTAEKIKDLCHKGDVIGVIGSLSESKYDKDGVSVTKLGVIADKMFLVDEGAVAKQQAQEAAKKQAEELARLSQLIEQ